MKSFRPASPRGIALVIVLAFLALISVLVVAFFTSVTTELRTARTSAAGVTTRQLADTATQFVIGQIREATASQGALTWASQPGMIRTYGTCTAAASTPYAYYKLYSSDNMVVGQGQIANWHPEVSDMPPDWLSQRALFTDLNAPVLVADPQGSITPGGGSTKYRAVYPIVDPTAEGSGTKGVQGFSIGSSPRLAWISRASLQASSPQRGAPTVDIASHTTSAMAWLARPGRDLHTQWRS